MVSSTMLRTITNKSARKVSRLRNGVKAKNAVKNTIKTAETSIVNTTEKTLPAAKSKKGIKGFIASAIEKLKNSSPTIGTAFDTADSIKAKGIKKSLPDIKQGIKKIIGVDDVAAARKSEGTFGAIKEGSRLGAKGLLTVAGGIFGFFVPFPGAQLAGMIAGEKLGIKIFGKRYSIKLAEKAAAKMAMSTENTAVKIGKNLRKRA